MVKLVDLKKKSPIRYIWALSKNSVTVFRLSAFHVWRERKSLISVNEMCLLPREICLQPASPRQWQQQLDVVLVLPSE